jgi:protein-tyrosine phosphatase
VILDAMRLLFVCMGNICRSPTAEAVMRRLVREAGLEDRIEIESAGTGGWHAGDPPDSRATVAAARRGVTLEGAARQIRADDFRDFDLLIAMDRENLRGLLAVAPDEAASEKVRLLREFDPASVGAPDLDVPDPYYGGDRGFESVLDMVEAACRGLIDELRAAEKV